MSSYVFCLFSSTLLLFVALRRYGSPLNGVKRSFPTYDAILSILSPHNMDLKSQLQARALPNARLERAFGIRASTFVSGDVAVHHNFTQQAIKLIPVGPRWPAALAAVARDTVEVYLMGLPATTSAEHFMPFDMFVQALTLRTIIIVLFEAEPDVVDSDPNDIHVVTRGIVDLWRLSKSDSPLPPHILADVNSCLTRWIPAIENPIEFVIPAFETLWRVVALAIAKLHEDDLSRKTLGVFLEQPSSQQFRDSPLGGPSVESMMIEVLRLYPPTRHISRSVPSSVSYIPLLGRLFSRNVIHIADVETAHRSHLWGPNPLDFDPMRHHPTRCSHEQKQARPLLSFGYGKLSCPAEKWAPHAAAVIVAVALENVGGVGSAFELVAGEKLGGREGWEGWLVQRKAARF